MRLRALLLTVLGAVGIFSTAMWAGNGPNNNKIPTAAQAAVQKKADPAKKGKMRGMSNGERWQAAIRNADRRAAKLRTHGKGVK